MVTAALALDAHGADAPRLLPGSEARVKAPGSRFVDPPSVLSDADADRYREIFALQELGRWSAADRLVGKLTDRRLMGHVLAQRYLHPTAYRSKYTELRAWMAAYADHPQAERIYRLALKRKTKGMAAPHAPVVKRAIPSRPRGDSFYLSDRPRNKAERLRVSHLKTRIRRNVLRTRLTITEKLLESTEVQRLFDPVEIDDGYAQVAAAWFYHGRNDKAYQLASGAAGRSGDDLPMTHWTAGLAAWRLGRLAEAADHFEALARSPNLSGWNLSAGAYWAARANLKLQRPQEMSRWLRLAAEHPHTFYGLLAHRALGMEIRFEFRRRILTAPMIRRLEATPEGSRALALLQVEERGRAEQELLRLRESLEPAMAEALLALAEQGRLPLLAFRLANYLSGIDDAAVPEHTLDAALYPVPPWRPVNGFIVDRALVYALMRQESSFNPSAKSPDGARGLMQLMPRTASYVAGDRTLRDSRRRDLFKPELNIELGQRYLAYLLSHAPIQGDLFKLVIAYNGGPGNLSKWERAVRYDDDPLLFIESLPSRETRLFIERVLTNLWIYRERLGQLAPSLDAVASGEWPRYVALDGQTQEVARHGSN